MKISRFLLYLTLFLMSFLILIPIMGTFLISVKSNRGIMLDMWGIPEQFDLENYIIAFDSLWRPLLNSCIIVLPAVAACVFIGSLAAYGLVMFKFRFSKIYYYFIVASTLIPAYVIMAPIFNIWTLFGLVDTYQGLILILTIMSFPYAAIILKSFFEKIPKELIEAAQLEGASHIDIYARIVMPISRGAILAAFLIEFTFSWNDFFWPLILAPSPSVQPVTIGILRLSGQYVAQWNYRAAGVLIAALLPLVLFFLFQKYFIKGFLGKDVIKG